MQTGFAFYYNKVIRTGIENIPTDKSVIFVSNHQNALIDPLLIGAYSPTELYFLTRAQVFKNPIVRPILYSINMLPIYRIRDGIKSLQKNEAVFKKCFSVLKDLKSVLIFAEGNHSLKRRVRPLSKGFTRITFGALDTYPDLDLVIVPVGLNYTDARAYGSKVNVVFGKPIEVKPYWENFPENMAVQNLREDVREAMKELTTHIDNPNLHDQIVRYFKKEAFLYPGKVNEELKNLNLAEDPQPSDPPEKMNLAEKIARLNSFFPLLIWKKIRKGIAEEEFIGTFKYTIAITLIPVFYIFQSIIIGYLISFQAGIIYLIFSVVLAYIAVRLKK